MNMNADCIVAAAVMVLLAVLGSVLMTGRGAWMIAGYNTLPRKERERYDERALCRFVGKVLFFAAAGVGLLLLDERWPGKGLGTVAAVWLPAGALFAVIYANTGRRFRKK